MIRGRVSTRRRAEARVRPAMCGERRVIREMSVTVEPSASFSMRLREGVAASSWAASSRACSQRSRRVVSCRAITARASRESSAPREAWIAPSRSENSRRARPSVVNSSAGSPASPWRRNARSPRCWARPTGSVRRSAARVSSGVSSPEEPGNHGALVMPPCFRRRCRRARQGPEMGTERRCGGTVGGRGADESGVRSGATVQRRGDAGLAHRPAPGPTM